MLKKYVKLLILALVSITYVGCTEDPFEWSKDMILAENIEVTDITTNSAKVSFDLKVGSGVTIEKLVVYCKYDNKIRATIDVTPVINGRCEALLNDLDKNTGYNIEIHVVAKTNAQQLSENLNNNRTVFFRTLDLYNLMPIPSDLTLSPNSLNSDIKTSCKLTRHDNDLPVIEAGFFYGSSSTTTFETGRRIVGVISDATLMGNISDLEIDATYYIGAYVTTAAGTLTSGPLSVQSGGFYFKMAVYEIAGNKKGFNFNLQLTGIPENGKLSNIIINAARPNWLEIYGQKEVEWNLSTLGITYIQDNNTYIYNLKNYNLTNTSMLSEAEYYFWFIIEWTDSNKKKHTTKMDRQPSWKVTTL